MRIFHNPHLQIASKKITSEVSLPNQIRCRKNYPWKNWGETASCQPEISFYPEKVEDLIDIVKFARNTKKRIRVAATGHSWSKLIPTDDILVYVHKLNHVEMDFSDQEKPKVLIECGATVKEVNNVLERHGYALPLNIVLESARFGGLIATGSHGSGWNNSTLSDLVHSIEIVIASGQLQRFETGIDDDEVMNAAKLNLGMFGITYRMKLYVQKSYTVRAVDRRAPLLETIENIKELIISHENCDLFWWPFCDQIWIKSWDKIDAEITAKPRKNLWYDFEAAITSRLFRETLKLLKRFPQLTPEMCKLFFKMTPSVRDDIVDLVEAIHYRRSIEVTKVGCLEIAFKVDPDFENVKKAINIVLEKNREYAAKGKYPLNLTMNVRFINGSQCLLSPAFGEGHTCFIEILSRADQKEWEQFSSEVALQWLKLPKALPHWAKEFEHIPGITTHIRREMGDNINIFNDIKQRLKLDIDNIFMNDLLMKIFLVKS
ncbi:FAD linked oxidase domain-containing protein [Calothrix sp. NIES-4071]|nr:FAD linked oxidase domain-containing protein [Calothrix sp. NIES-4071]BAZ57902.1 FAD linked oxidase domain-containing protein [Calothrix sp. NIES-4105]